MRLGILAINIRSGGGAAHLSQILSHATPEKWGIRRVRVWCRRALAERLPERRWLELDHRPVFERSLPVRVLWELTTFDRVAAGACDSLFVPGATYWGAFRPYVAMAQNLLPFTPRELDRFGWTPAGAKFRLLRLAQTRCLKRAAGVIFPTGHCRRVVTEAVGGLKGLGVVVPHGMDDRFRCPPRGQKPISDYSPLRPFRILYVSTINAYKHQDLAVEAVKALRDRGLPVALDLVGGASARALKRLNRTLDRLDRRREFVRYLGKQPFDRLHETYAGADCFLLASSCESLGIVLLEAMASGLPIACSDLAPMSDLLGGAGELFEAENPAAMAAALRKLIDDPDLRSRLAQTAHRRAEDFTWSRAAEETFAFLVRAASGRRGNAASPSRPSASKAGDAPRAIER